MAKGYNTVPFGFERMDAEPFLKNELFASLEEAQAYATTNPTAYAGQRISVVSDGKAEDYTIQPDKSLKLSGGSIEWQEI